MNKKIYILLLILFVGICFTGCKSKEEIDKDRGYRDYLVAGDKIGVSQVYYYNNEEIDKGTITINLTYVDSLTDVTFEDIEEVLNPEDYGFTSKDAKFTGLYVKKGGIELTYTISEAENGVVTQFEYIPKEDHNIKDSNGNILYGFTIEQIPYVNDKLV
jgi:hypothetical protein